MNQQPHPLPRINRILVLDMDTSNPHTRMTVVCPAYPWYPRRMPDNYYDNVEVMYMLTQALGSVIRVVETSGQMPIGSAFTQTIDMLEQLYADTEVSLLAGPEMHKQAKTNKPGDSVTEQKTTMENDTVNSELGENQSTEIPTGPGNAPAPEAVLNEGENTTDALPAATTTGADLASDPANVAPHQESTTVTEDPGGPTELRPEPADEVLPAITAPIPTVARIVHYYPNGADAEAAAHGCEYVPAMVVKVNEGHDISLNVFTLSERVAVARFNIQHQDAAAPGTAYWVWPPRN